MNEYLLLKFLHIVAFVYWLGGDLGTFLASKQVVNRNIGVEARAVALKIMLACDQGPKMSMPLILPLGIHMAAISGVMLVPGWAVAIMWLLSLLWLGNVLVLYFNEGKPFTQSLAKFDFWFRIAVVLALSIWAIMALLDSGLANASWPPIKILIFAAMVGCGLMIRVHLKPFVPAFGQLMSSGASDEVNSAMEQSIGRCRPYVWGIWLGLFVNAALGTHLI